MRNAIRRDMSEEEEKLKRVEEIQEEQGFFWKEKQLSKQKKISNLLQEVSPGVLLATGNGNMERMCVFNGGGLVQ